MSVMDISKLNQKQYGDLMGVRQAAISYRLRKGIPLPGVVKTEKFNDWWILHFDNDTNIEKAKKDFKIVHK